MWGSSSVRRPGSSSGAGDALQESCEQCKGQGAHKLPCMAWRRQLGPHSCWHRRLAAHKQFKFGGTKKRLAQRTPTSARLGRGRGCRRPSPPEAAWPAVNPSRGSPPGPRAIAAS